MAVGRVDCKSVNADICLWFVYHMPRLHHITQLKQKKAFIEQLEREIETMEQDTQVCDMLRSHTVLCYAAVMFTIL